MCNLLISGRNNPLYSCLFETLDEFDDASLIQDCSFSDEELGGENDSLRPCSPAYYCQEFLKDSDNLKNDLFPKEKEAIKKNIEDLTKYPDSPRQRKRGEKLSSVSSVFNKGLSSQRVNSPGFHRDAYPILDRKDPNGERTMLSLAKQIENIPCQYPSLANSAQLSFPIINFKHIMEGENDRNKLSGKHYLQPGEETTIIDLQTNAITGIRCGRYTLTGGSEEKFSTFFPERIRNEEELKTLLLSSQKVYHKGESESLYKTTTHAPFFYVKELLHGKNLIHSAFPIFYFENFEENASFQILDNYVIQSDDLKRLGVFSKSVAQNALVEFEGKDDVILDIAPLFKDATTIEHGIYISFPKNLFPQLDEA